MCVREKERAVGWARCHAFVTTGLKIRSSAIVHRMASNSGRQRKKLEIADYCAGVGTRQSDGLLFLKAIKVPERVPGNSWLRRVAGCIFYRSERRSLRSPGRTEVARRSARAYVGSGVPKRINANWMKPASLHGLFPEPPGARPEVPALKADGKPSRHSATPFPAGTGKKTSRPLTSAGDRGKRPGLSGHWLLLAAPPFIPPAGNLTPGTAQGDTRQGCTFLPTPVCAPGSCP